MSIKGILRLAAKGSFIAVPLATLAFAAPAAADEKLSDAIRGYKVATVETTARSLAGEFKSLEQAIKVADVIQRDAGYKVTTKVIGNEGGTYSITQDRLNDKEFKKLAYLVGIKRDWRTGAQTLVGQQKMPNGKTLFWEAPIPRQKGAELKYTTYTNG